MQDEPLRNALVEAAAEIQSLGKAIEALAGKEDEELATLFAAACLIDLEKLRAKLKQVKTKLSDRTFVKWV